MDDETTKTPKRKPSSKRGKQQASSILRAEVNGLLDLMVRVKELGEQKDSFEDVLVLLEGIGRTSTRLVTLLKAEKDLAEDQSKSQAISEAAARVLEKRRKAAEAKEAEKKVKNEGPSL